MWAAPSSRQMLSVAGADLPCIGGGEAILVGGGLASLSFQSSYVPDDRPSGGDALMGLTLDRPRRHHQPRRHATNRGLDSFAHGLAGTARSISAAGSLLACGGSGYSMLALALWAWLWWSRGLAFWVSSRGG